MSHTPTPVQIGQIGILHGEIVVVRSVRGRWVQMADGHGHTTNVSRAEAAAAVVEYADRTAPVGRSNGIVPAQYLVRFVRTKTARADGTVAVSRDTADDLAIALRGLSADEIVAISMVVAGSPSWAGKNNGQRSMCARNALRRYLREGGDMGTIEAAIAA